MKYRKKPVMVEAFQLGVDEMPSWFVDAEKVNKVILHGGRTHADIKTLEGWHHANYGDFIIRGVKGEIYPCKPDIFHLTYEEVSQ